MYCPASNVKRERLHLSCWLIHVEVIYVTSKLNSVQKSYHPSLFPHLLYCSCYHIYNLCTYIHCTWKITVIIVFDRKKSRYLQRILIRMLSIIVNVCRVYQVSCLRFTAKVFTFAVYCDEIVKIIHSAPTYLSSLQDYWINRIEQNYSKWNFKCDDHSIFFLHGQKIHILKKNMDSVKISLRRGLTVLSYNALNFRTTVLVSPQIPKHDKIIKRFVCDGCKKSFD